MRTAAFAVGLLGVLLPVGVVFADDGMMGPPPPPDNFNGTMHAQFQGPQGEINIEMRGQAGGMMGSSTGEHMQYQAEWQGSASGTPPLPPMHYEGEASGTPWMSGIKAGIEERFGTTTPPGMMVRGEGTSSAEFHVWGEAGSSTNEGAPHGMMQPSAGVSAFFRWLFGLPASTTIGEIQTSLEASSTTNVEASSTASSTIQAPTPFVFGDFFDNIFAGFRGFFGGR